MTEPTELLPCPFCGAAAHFEMDEGRWEWVECESCGMQGNRSASLMEDCKPKLAEEWNRRTPPAVAGMLEVTEAECEAAVLELEIEDLHTTQQPTQEQAVQGVQWQCGPQASGFTAPQADSQPAPQPLPASQGDALEAALPMQPICIASDGVVRFKRNRMVDDMYEFSKSRGFGLNEMVRRDYTQEERMQFAQLIGYSVSGYGSLSYASPESVEKADAIAASLVAARKQGENHD